MEAASQVRQCQFDKLANFAYKFATELIIALAKLAQRFRLK